MIEELIGKTVLIRAAYNSFYGTLTKYEHVWLYSKKYSLNVELSPGRRVWYWAGAASPSELAKRGTSKPGKCKFPDWIDLIVLTQVLEILPMTEEAIKSLNAVPVWTTFTEEGVTL